MSDSLSDIVGFGELVNRSDLFLICGNAYLLTENVFSHTFIYNAIIIRFNF